MKPAWIPSGLDDPQTPPCDFGPAAVVAVDELFRSEHRDLVRYVARAHGEDAAQDVVQRVFARLVALGSEHLRSIARPRSYLRTAARNAARDEARNRHRQAEIPAECEEDLAGAAVDPIAMLEARDRLVRIDAALLKLKPLTRQIFLARRFDGYSYAEIAQQTGLSIKGVEKQMSRAIHQLGRHLHPDV